MLKTRSLRILFFFPCLLLALMALPSTSWNFKWGSSLAQIEKAAGQKNISEKFTAGEKKKYQNRMLKHILRIDPEAAKRIMILRINSIPVTDYLFLGGKLACVLEKWKAADADTENGLIRNLTDRFGKGRAEKKKNFTVHHFQDRETAVCLYSKNRVKNQSSCRIYFYSRGIYRQLLLEGPPMPFPDEEIKGK